MPPTPHPPPTAALRVVLWGTFDASTARVRLLRAGLRLAGSEVVDCHVPIWGEHRDKTRLRGLRGWAGVAWRMAWAYPVLAWRYLRLPAHDVVLVAHPGLLDVFMAWPLAKARGSRLAWDWFVGAFDTVVADRKLVEDGHWLGVALKMAEWMACRLADIPFMDTAAHARRMEHIFGLARGRVGHVWVGVEHDRFPEAQHRGQRGPHQRLRVMFYGQFIPLHGADVIVEAAALLREEPVDWLLVGDGQEAVKVDSRIRQLELGQVERRAWVPYEELVDEMGRADVVLGVFGTSDKAASVIPNKVFQALACRKPVITRRGPGMDELVDGGMDGVRLVDPGDARALAQAVSEALDNARLGRPPDIISRINARAIGRQAMAVLGREVDGVEDARP